ncbi:MAG: BlaI/MecI/CopY family transcriptional regulator [Actinomycetota bacterium]
MEYPKVFRPREEGLSKIFGELEADIMEIMWDREEATVKDVYQILLQDRDIAYTTVMTVVGRLSDKGVLNKRHSANKFIYCPACSRDEILEQVSKEVIDGLMDVGRKPVLSHLTGMMGELKPEELERLREELNKAIANKNKDTGV